MENQTTSQTPALRGNGVLTEADALAAAVTIPISERARVMRELCESIPNNEYGLPTYLYRADLIPGGFESLPPKEQNDYIDAATVELDYQQGFPVLPDGEPFWSTLPGEHPDAHRAFIHYLDMPRQAAKDDRGQIGLATPVRQLHLLKDMTGKSTSDLMGWCIMFYWPQRARAYDMFIMASHNKQKEYRLQEAENSHFGIATKFIEYAQTFLDGVFADPNKYELTPKEAMDLLVKMIQVQRLSLGVAPFGSSNGKGAGGSDALPQGASFEVILRQIAQNAGMATGTNKGSDVTRQLFDDPEALESAQELIIKLNGMKNPRLKQNVSPTASGFFDSEDSA